MPWLRLLSMLSLRSHLRRVLARRWRLSVLSPRYFLFVSEAGSCLGGMQDYYGAYDDLPAAQRAVPVGVDWAEVATIEAGSLVVVLTGERDGACWWWLPSSTTDGTVDTRDTEAPLSEPAA